VSSLCKTTSDLNDGKEVFNNCFALVYFKYYRMYVLFISITNSEFVPKWPRNFSLLPNKTEKDNGISATNHESV